LISRIARKRVQTFKPMFLVKFENWDNNKFDTNWITIFDIQTDLLKATKSRGRERQGGKVEEDTLYMYCPKDI